MLPALSIFKESPAYRRCSGSYRGVTNALNSLQPGDKLIIGDARGAIDYKGEGYFIAGGAGITPFIAIFRQLKKQNMLQGNKLFFSNTTENDVILQHELSEMLNDNAIYTITDEASKLYHNGYIDEKFLIDHVDDFSKHFYLCGPVRMIESMHEILTRRGVSPEAVVFEK